MIEVGRFSKRFLLSPISHEGGGGGGGEGNSARPQIVFFKNSVRNSAESQNLENFLKLMENKMFNLKLTNLYLESPYFETAHAKKWSNYALINRECCPYAKIFVVTSCWHGVTTNIFRMDQTQG